MAALRPLRRSRPVALLVALAVLVLAVVPHATFAAALQPRMLVTVAHDMHAASTDAAPCHGKREAKPAKAMANCCAMGCAILVPVSQTVVTTRFRAGDRLPPPSMILRPGISPQPAERPPREGQLV